MKTIISDFKATTLKLFDNVEQYIDSTETELRRISGNPNYTQEYKQQKCKELFDNIRQTLTQNNSLLVYLNSSKKTLEDSTLNRNFFAQSSDRATYQSALVSALELARSLKGIITKEQFQALATDYKDDPLAVKAFNNIVLTLYSTNHGITNKTIYEFNDWLLPLPPRVSLLESVDETIINISKTFNNTTFNTSYTYAAPTLWTFQNSMYWDTTRQIIENDFPDNVTTE